MNGVVTVKAVASVEELPEYEDVSQARELSVNTSANGESYSVIDFFPVNGHQLIPSRIYLAILAVTVSRNMKRIEAKIRVI